MYARTLTQREQARVTIQCSQLSVSSSDENVNVDKSPLCGLPRQRSEISRFVRFLYPGLLRQSYTSEHFTTHVEATTVLTPVYMSSKQDAPDEPLQLQDSKNPCICSCAWVGSRTLCSQQPVPGQAWIGVPQLHSWTYRGARMVRTIESEQNSIL